ncbi:MULTISPECIES: CsbD family protein [unclassified Streptomyces]|uniref:CsbD family protein n=1 Tax=unclassified Streptomyces TaxID=2593676 RepID=UPI000DBA2D67|nr:MULTISPECIES: CsbD family protein [Streptomyces]MYU04840.1 CsbD family protein [Streptomyces sp. SID8366]MYU61903.1 CsbD family protein [Streptomyces sp. SID69]RAJ48751.1 CsbD-like protein [Streptomyces sp. PsTaAH-130]TXJ78768.1 CsbD family protein [Streptomyces lavendulae]
MSASEKAKATSEQVKGKSKEALGSAVGNDRMAAEGQAEKSTGDARAAKEKTKDAFKH